MEAFVYVAIHICAYAAWRIPAWQERTTRPDGAHIPIYATGGPGNIFGFSMLTLAIGMTHTTLSVFEALIAGGVGVIVTILLHRMWQYDARLRKSPVSLYLRSGHPTRAGVIHLGYVWFIAMLVALLVLSLHEMSAPAIVLACTGIMVYLFTVFTDIQRGVI